MLVFGKTAYALKEWPHSRNLVLQPRRQNTRRILWNFIEISLSITVLSSKDLVLLCT